MRKEKIKLFFQKNRETNKEHGMGDNNKEQKIVMQHQVQYTSVSE